MSSIANQALAYLIIYTIITSAWAQSIGLTIYPQQVVTGETYTVAWESNDQPTTIELVRGGKTEDTLLTSDGTSNSFQWTVQDDYSGGSDYSLKFSSGDVSQTTNLDIIEDEDGLVVSGVTITTPTPTSMITATTSLSSVASASPSITSATATTQSSASTPTMTSTPSSSATSVHTTRGLSDGAIAGIVVGVLVFAALSGVAVWLCLKRRASLSKHIDADPISSFLELGRGNRTSGTIKGTSPEAAAVSQVSPAWIPRKPVGISELPGESAPPRGPLHGQTQLGLMTRVFEVNRKPVRYEMSSEI